MISLSLPGSFSFKSLAIAEKRNSGSSELKISEVPP